jgi:PAS domain S-box-containing protein
MLEGTYDALLLLEGTEARIGYANTQAERLLGRARAALLGRPLEELLSDESRVYHRGLHHKASHGEAVLGELEVLVDSQPARPVEIGYRLLSAPEGLRIVVLLRDLLERKRSEKERSFMATRRQEMQRLDSLNVLVGGVAHDFNNILMSILGYAIMGRDKSGEAADVKRFFTQIEGSTIKAGELCRKMLAFAGRGEVTLNQGQLNDLVRELEPSLRDNIGNKAKLELELMPSLDKADFDLFKLSQVVVCLMQNALEALDHEPRNIRIRTYFSRRGDPRRTDGFVSPDLPRGDCQVLEVSDTGCGISPDRINRIFEPFFSTKFIGRGLGLSEALGTIRAHKGAIQVVSTFGVGSSFRLYIPVSDPSIRPAPGNSAPPFLASAVQRSLALVVEDVETNRDLVVQLLRDCGYSVRSAPDGREALVLLESLGTRLTLVILDLSMPDISGDELLRRIRMSKHKDMRVIIMSGHTKEEAYERCYPFRPDGFLPKPFSIEDLRRAIA